MRIQPYSLDELQFAWSNRVYFRSRTHRRIPSDSLVHLTKEVLEELLEPYGIHLLEFVTDAVEFRAALSLSANESASVAASKLKGRIGKWLGAQRCSDQPVKNLARGYFASTCGSSNSQAVEMYLEKQAEHHGYAERVRSPVYVRQPEHSGGERKCLETDHAVTVLRYHLVMATTWRRGVFEPASAESVCRTWIDLQLENRYLLDKVSFLPDHVHLAVTVHPAVKPGELVVALMNSAQELLWQSFEHLAVNARLERLWQPGAYVGSFGDLTSKAIRAYMHRWEESRD